MATFDIRFNNRNKLYRTGELIECDIQMYVRKPIRTGFVSIRFMGIAHTGWTKSKQGIKHRNDTGRTVGEYFTADQELFKNYQFLVGDINGSPQTIETGNYFYQASFQLPSNIPTSFESKYGYVRYSVKIKYDTSWAPNKVHREWFFVKPHIDLNYMPHLFEKINVYSEKTFGYCCCFESDPLDLIIACPRRGWAVGERIPVAIEVKNDSNVTINAIKLKFYEMLAYTAKSPKDVRTKVTNLSKQFFNMTTAPLQKRIYSAELYLDPSFQWKIFNGCTIISCDYVIKVTAIPKGCYKPLETKAYIMVGTVAPTEDATNAWVTAPPDTTFEQPLPSYDEVVS